jgi:hypothetical protein
MSDQPSFTCPDCGAKSYNPNDIREGYCGRCHRWTGDQELNTLREGEAMMPVISFLIHPIRFIREWRASRKPYDKKD